MMKRMFRVGVKLLVKVKKEKTLIMTTGVYMNTTYVRTRVCFRK